MYIQYINKVNNNYLRYISLIIKYKNLTLIFKKLWCIIYTTEIENIEVYKMLFDTEGIIYYKPFLWHLLELFVQVYNITWNIEMCYWHYKNLIIFIYKI